MASVSISCFLSCKTIISPPWCEMVVSATLPSGRYDHSTFTALKYLCINHGDQSVIFDWNHHKISQLYLPLHLDIYVMGLGSIKALLCMQCLYEILITFIGAYMYINIRIRDKRRCNLFIKKQRRFLD